MAQSFKQYLIESAKGVASSAPSSAPEQDTFVTEKESDLHRLGISMDVYNGNRDTGKTKVVTAHLYKRFVKKIGNVNHITVDGIDYFSSVTKTKVLVGTNEPITEFKDTSGHRLYVTNDLKKLVWD